MAPVRLIASVCQISGFALFVMLAGCEPCAGLTGDALKKCEAEQTSDGGLSPSACTDLGIFTSAMDTSAISAGDFKCYAFTLDEVGSVTFTVADYAKLPALSFFQDTNGNHLFESSEQLHHSWTYSNSPSIALPLEKGTYYLRVGDAATSYYLSGTYERHPQASPPIDPGDKPNDSALNLGVLSSAKWGGYVGRVDKEDYYRFQLDEVGSATFTVADYQTLPGLSIIRDANQNGLFEDSDLLHTSWTFSNSPTVSLPLEKGIYFLRVGGAETTYTLSSVHTPHPQSSPARDPGEKPDDSALDLGVLQSAKFGGYIGRVDREDHFKLTVIEPGKATFTVADHSALPAMTVIQDKNGNGLFEPSEAVASNQGQSTLSYTASAGTYFFRLSDAETTYTLSCSMER